MTDDDTRLDARVRRALTALPAPDDIETRTALLDVLQRSTGATRARRSVMRRWGPPLAAAAAVGVVAATAMLTALVATGPDRTAPLERPVPDTLTGTWQRRVPASEAGTMAGRWTMTLTSDGVLALSGPAGAPSAEGASYSSDLRQVRVDAFVNSVCGELPAGTYAWTVAGGGLNLSLVNDPCLARADVFDGTWRAVP